MGYVTITDQEAYLTAIYYLKGESKSRLNLSAYSGGYIMPGSEIYFSHPTENTGSVDSGQQIKIEQIIDLEKLTSEYGDLKQFFKKPISTDTISSSKARERRKNLEEEIRKYIKPEHRVYRKQIEKTKTAENI